MSLALIATYSDNEESDVEEPKEKKRKLVLKNPIKDLKIGLEGSEQVPEDDPALHDFRIRSFAHVRGNWATYLFIDTSKVTLDPLQTLVKKC